MLTKVITMITSIDPNCTATVFGSFATGLCLMNSDVDIHVKTNDSLGLLYKLQDCLYSSDFISNAKIINAKV